MITQCEYCGEDLKNMDIYREFLDVQYFFCCEACSFSWHISEVKECTKK